MIGTFERNILGRFIYKTPTEYKVYKAQGMKFLGSLPRSFNIWQNVGQLAIWFLTRNW